MVKVIHIIKLFKPDKKCEFKLIVKQFLNLTFFMQPIDSKIIDFHIVHTQILSNEFEIDINAIWYKICIFSFISKKQSHCLNFMSFIMFIMNIIALNLF